jgi:hypothetical protein
MPGYLNSNYEMVRSSKVPDACSGMIQAGYMIQADRFLLYCSGEAEYYGI